MFVPVDLNVSFRSTPAVLDAVDWVFGETDAARGVGEAGTVGTCPAASDEPGRVELWPLVVGSEDEADTTDVEAIASAAAQGLPHERLARLIAAHAKQPDRPRSAAHATARRCMPATSWCWCGGATSS